MAHFLVTGGAGFIGSHLVEHLLSNGHTVRVLDDLSTGKVENVPDGVELLQGSVTVPEAVNAAVQGIDGCFHLAAIASVQQCQQDWVDSHTVNVTGTLMLMEASVHHIQDPSRAMFPVVYTSSAAVYGEVEQMPISEATPPRPLGPYGADKLGCDLHADGMRRVHGLPCAGVRPFNVYGPRQDPSSPYSGVISIFADRIPQGQGVTIFGDGQQTRDFIYVKDVAEAFANAMERMLTGKVTPAITNLCTGQKTTITELAEHIAAACDTEVEITYEDAREGDIRHSVGDPERIHALLERTELTSLEEGLRALLG